jgi:hypothetical protein
LEGWRQGGCRVARGTHAVLGAVGVLLLVGVMLVELLGLAGDTLETLGALVVIPFTLLLFSAAPLSLGAVLLCREDGWLVLQSLAHLLFLVILLAVDAARALLITLCFAGYAALTCYAAWRRGSGARV